MRAMKIWFGLLCLNVWVQVAHAGPDDSTENFISTFPAGSIQSLEQANNALSEGAKTREQILARHAQAERVCYTRFVVTPCLDEAREVRRKGLAAVRLIEVEAARFKRQTSLQEQNKSLEERRRAAELDAPDRLLRAQEFEKSQIQKEKSLAEKEKQQANKAPIDELAIERQREDDHEEKLEKQRSKDEADVGKRAKNIANYEKKQQAAKLRLAEYEAKKKEREAKNAAKAARATTQTP
jgi:colicin import membrane protein